MNMPKICEHCGKEHATLEELEALTSGGLVNSSDIFGDGSSDVFIISEPTQKKIRLKKKE